MPAKWQRWMPLKIDALKGSPAVQAMHPAARIGYLYLLTSQWQSEDGTISSDPVDLADESGLGDDLWITYGPRILRKFDQVDGLGGRLRNAVCHEEWLEAKRIFDQKETHRQEISQKRSEAAKIANAIRWGSQKGTFAIEVDRKLIANNHNTTTTSSQNDPYTGTYTSTETKDKKPYRAKRADPSKTALAATRHAEFKAAIFTYWESKNPGVPIPWDGAEGKQLGMWLSSSPAVTIEQFTGYLRGRFKSDVNHAERPSRWIANVSNFANGPIDRYNKPLSGALAHAKPADPDREARLKAITERELAQFERRPA